MLDIMMALAEPRKSLRPSRGGFISCRAGPTAGLEVGIPLLQPQALAAWAGDRSGTDVWEKPSGAGSGTIKISVWPAIAI